LIRFKDKYQSYFIATSKWLRSWMHPMHTLYIVGFSIAI